MLLQAPQSHLRHLRYKPFLGPASQKPLPRSPPPLPLLVGPPSRADCPTSRVSWTEPFLQNFLPLPEG